METRKMKLALSAGAVALSMALAGCGGSSSGGGASGSPPQPTAEMTAATDAINAALAAVNALTSESDATAIMDAQTLINTASRRVDALPDDEEASYDARIAAIQTNHNNAEQRVVVAGAIQAASAAVDALMITSEQTEIDRVQGLINDASTAIDDLPDAEEAPQDAVVARIQTRHDNAEAGAVAERNRVIAEQNRKTTEEQRLILAKVSGLFEVVTSESRNAAKAQMDAAAARADAQKKRGELSATAMTVKGNSEKAKDNAQDVLDAVGKVDQEVTNAQSALNALNAAKTEAEALDGSVSQKAGLIAAIDAAIKDAMDNYKAAKALADARGANSVFLLAQQVKGGINGDDTADDWAKRVASDILNAIDAVPAQSPRTPGVPTVSTSSLVPTAFSSAGVSGKGINNHAPSITMKLEQIVGTTSKGESRVDKGRIVDGNRTDVISLEGLSTSVVAGAALAAVGSGNTDQTARSGSRSYRGIAGTFHCLNDSCSVSNNTLGSGWYFDPTDDIGRLYQPSITTANRYQPYNDYVEYGYWLVASTDGGALDQIHTFANTYAAVHPGGAGLTSENIDGDRARATYKGSAVGMAVVTGPDGSDAGTDPDPLRSSQFTADVTLNARFGGTPHIDGTVTNFQDPEGRAIGSSWSLTLGEHDLTAGGTGTAATTGGGADPGTWTARPYVDEGSVAPSRPNGIIGDFVGNFTDGRAVGAYATRKQ